MKYSINNAVFASCLYMNDQKIFKYNHQLLQESKSRRYFLVGNTRISRNCVTKHADTRYSCDSLFTSSDEAPASYKKLFYFLLGDDEAILQSYGPFSYLILYNLDSSSQYNITFTPLSIKQLSFPLQLLSHDNNVDEIINFSTLSSIIEAEKAPRSLSSFLRGKLDETMVTSLDTKSRVSQPTLSNTFAQLLSDFRLLQQSPSTRGLFYGTILPVPLLLLLILLSCCCCCLFPTRAANVLYSCVDTFSSIPRRLLCLVTCGLRGACTNYQPPTEQDQQ